MHDTEEIGIIPYLEEKTLPVTGDKVIVLASQELVPYIHARVCSIRFADHRAGRTSIQGEEPRPFRGEQDHEEIEHLCDKRLLVLEPGDLSEEVHDKCIGSGFLVRLGNRGIAILFPPGIPPEKILDFLPIASGTGTIRIPSPVRGALFLQWAVMIWSACIRSIARSAFPR